MVVPLPIPSYSLNLGLQYFHPDILSNALTVSYKKDGFTDVHGNGTCFKPEILLDA